MSYLNKIKVLYKNKKKLNKIKVLKQKKKQMKAKKKIYIYKITELHNKITYISAKLIQNINKCYIITLNTGFIWCFMECC